ncbi:MAG: sulfotransferase family protein [Phenylobacterium sp.]|nr:sulfotransferase family protein [Phenylobacterium sp.]
MSDTGSAPKADEIELFQETVAAAQAGDLAKAFFLAGGALHHGLEHPLFYKLRGLEHQQWGRAAQAEADFRAALADAPDDFTLLDMLGLSLAAGGRLAEALQAIDSALRIRPDYPPALVNRGWVLENLGDLAGARAAYRSALSISPTEVRAHSGLALLAARAGRSAEARREAAEALRLANGEPGARLALAMAALSEGDAPGSEREARALLAEPQPLHPQQVGVAHTVLGDALDRQERFGEAFEAYERANAALRAHYGPQFGDGGTASGMAVVERLRRGFAAVKASDWSRGPSADDADAQGHAFVLGFPRSGTTLVGQVLDAHPRATTLDELETLAEPGATYLVDEAGLARLAGAPPAELADFRRRYWDRIAAAGVAPAGRLLVDKLPMNTLGLPVIARLFPAAKVVFVRRDPRDVVLSCFRRQFVMNGANWEFLSLESAARFYDAVMRLAQDYLQALPLDVHVLRYENLVGDFAGEAERLRLFLGLPPDPAMREFTGAANAADIATPSAAQVAGGLSGEGVGTWRRYEAQLEPVMPVLAPWIETFGY